MRTKEQAFCQSVPMVASAESGCWLWAGRADNGGYGRTVTNEVGTLVHRLFYAVLVGDIEPGMHIDHLCRNRLCCNPDHLEQVTQRENDRRKIESLGGKYRASGGKHLCRRGHEFTEENTRMERAGRRCLTCKRESRKRNEAEVVQDGARP